MTDPAAKYVLSATDPERALLTDPAGERRRLRLEGRDWVVEHAAGERRLRRGNDPDTVVLLDGEGKESGRLGAVLGAGDPWPADVLLADGRVFRVSLRAGADPHFEVRSWEAPGAYLTARANGDGWTLEPTTAGRRLPGLDDLVLMLAVRILDTTAG